MRAPITGQYPADWSVIAADVKAEAGNQCVRCGRCHAPKAGYTMTVHHFDGDKSNCARWNLMPLCQRCHLSVQARVDPNVGYFYDPRAWVMPYIAGFYEAGRGVRPKSYDLARWISQYVVDLPGKWPDWAPRPGG